MKKHIKRIIYLLLMFGFTTLNAQIVSENTDLNSTNTKGYSNINIDLFRGKNSINIPIYNFKLKNINVPITIDYYPIDLNENGKRIHASIVGLGWNLNVGGVISRSVNGVPDETNIIGNFYNSDINFDPVTYIYQLINHETGEDEFTFNFLGYSGSFIYYRGVWKIFSDANFLIEKFTEPNGVGGNILTGFNLEAPDGIIYTFGVNNGIEYSEKGYVPSNRTPNAWYLTKILTPDLEEINFEYKSDNYSIYNPVIYQTTTRIKMKWYESNTYHETNYIDKTPSDEEISNLSIGNYNVPVYVSRISSPNTNISVKFNHELYNYMKYPELIKNSMNIFTRLKDIEIKSNNTAFKKFDFSYYNSQINHSLKLKSVSESGIYDNGNSVTLPEYQFEYVSELDQTSPEVLNKITYPSGGFTNFEFEKNDYYMYFKIFATDGTFLDGYQPTGNFQEDQNWFNTYIDISNNLMTDGFRIKREISKSSDNDIPIITTYYYTEDFPELNPDLSFRNKSSGIRNRESAFQRNDITYSYCFNNSITNYVEKNTPYNDCLYPNELPNSTVKNSLLGYSSVWKVQSEGNNPTSSNSLGYTNYKYINYIKIDEDNAQIIHNDINIAGKPIGIFKFDSQKNEISSVKYEYSSSVKTTLNRFFINSTMYLCNNGVEYSILPGYYSTKFCRYYLTKEEKTENNFSVIKQYKYNYQFNNLEEMSVIEPVLNYASLDPQDITESDYNITTTSFKYMIDFAPLYQSSMHIQQLYHIPVEKVVRKNGNVIAAEFIKYIRLNGNASTTIRPYQIYTLNVLTPTTNYSPSGYDWNVTDSRFKLSLTYDQYDSFGNLLQYHAEGSAPVAYYYNYNNLKSVPEIVAVNCTYNNLSQNFISFSQDNMLRLRKNLPNAEITNYTFDSKFGMPTSETTPNGITTYWEYDVFGRINCIKNKDNKILQLFEYKNNLQQP